MGARILTVLLSWAALIAAPPVHGADVDYAALFAKGITFAEFLDGARQRRDEWRAHYAAAADEAPIARARALQRPWRLLVVAEDWCGDSVNTVPYLAKLADAAPDRLTLRIVSSATGRAVMEAHRTPDGRAATPTVVVLDEAGALQGAWVERPAALLAWIAERGTSSDAGDLHDLRYKWYADDGGRHAVSEILDLIESTARR